MMGLDKFDIGQLHLLFFLSLEIENSSTDFRNMLLFQLSRVQGNPKPQIKHFLRFFTIGTTCEEDTDLSDSTIQLIHSLLNLYQDIVPLYLKSYDLESLLTLLTYFKEASPNPVKSSVLELLLLHFSSLAPQNRNIDRNLFHKIYVTLSEMDIPGSKALADNFNLILADIVAADLQTINRGVKYLTGKPSGNENRPDYANNSQLKEELLRSQILEQDHSLRRTLDYTWAYLKNCHRSGQTKFVEKRLAQDMISVVNGMVIGE